MSELIDRQQYPQLDVIAWHMAGKRWIEPSEAFSLYEANWKYVEVGQLTERERALIAQLALSYGNGLFAPLQGQPIEIEGVRCV
ncbi:MAG: hypothetical protein AB7U63_19465 [Porticoccaceae bacterium]